MFFITSSRLKTDAYKRELSDSTGGALAIFEGKIRRRNNEKQVRFVEYEAAQKLALRGSVQIIGEIKKKFDILKIKCAHRTGKVRPGETAVWVGVLASHRKSAFDACQYAIDAIKSRLPIWKKEHYKDGSAQWISGASIKAPVSKKNAILENEFYARQLSLPAIGPKGQAKIKNARVLVVGAGGLGSPALTYLAGSGVGLLGICEPDKLETSNLHRQPLYSHRDIGQSKATLAARRIRAANPFVRVKVHKERITADNLRGISRFYDLIVDCTDNFHSKFLLNDFAVIHKVPLIQASIFQSEGQLTFYRPGGNDACLRCLWPQIPDDNCQGACVRQGVLGVAPGILGTMQAMEALKFILGLPGCLGGEILTFDFLSYEIRRIKQRKDPSCPVCGKKPVIKKITAKNYPAASDLVMDISRMAKKSLRGYCLVDVREPQEIRDDGTPGISCANIPMSTFYGQVGKFDSDKKYLLFCRSGMRSLKLTRELRARGITKSFSLLGGKQSLTTYFRN